MVRGTKKLTFWQSMKNWLDSHPAKAIGLLSSIITIATLAWGLMTHYHQPGTISSNNRNSPAVNTPNTSPTISSDGLPAKKDSSAKPLHSVTTNFSPPTIATGIIVQKAEGSQNTNLNGIGGNVTIQYGTPEEKAVEKSK